MLDTIYGGACDHKIVGQNISESHIHSDAISNSIVAPLNNSIPPPPSKELIKINETILSDFY